MLFVDGSSNVFSISRFQLCLGIVVALTDLQAVGAGGAE